VRTPSVLRVNLSLLLGREPSQESQAA